MGDSDYPAPQPDGALPVRLDIRAACPSELLMGQRAAFSDRSVRLGLRQAVAFSQLLSRAQMIVLLWIPSHGLRNSVSVGPERVVVAFKDASSDFAARN